MGKARHKPIRVPSPAFERFLTAPRPSPRLPVRDAALLAIDLETTGLKARSDMILSIGAVEVRHGVVEVGTAFHQVVRPDDAGLPAETGATIHGLGHDRLAAGVPLPVALDQLWDALAGKALIAHGAALERAFLDRACRRLYGERFKAPVVDTLTVEQRRPAQRRDGGTGQGGLRLDAVRRRYGLPRYRAHHALSDALACAELFLAQMAHAGDAPPLKRFLS
ncbi:hypothetical protein CCR85_11495 [Rhodothalassium salexigens]|uniref:exonuclease domain-containing protein n=1 Tax=Rhodothalassium salexigens TaxID=1086 RepID=UPI001913C1F8|nr:exonuclease domain-containing protein [Rhodothalassium salexigens]MBK5912113.1 hypothetical protein [Rhodothalassium salexigens]